jgi:diguanylate cyclase (GGDEF)-like protein
MNPETADSNAAAAAHSIALLIQRAHELQAEVLRWQAASSPPQGSGAMPARSDAARDRLARASLHAAEMANLAMQIVGALAEPGPPPAESTAPASPAHPEARLRDLRDANERLILATLRAQELEREGEAVQRQQLNFMAILAHELRNPVAPIRHAIKLLGSPAVDEAQKRWSRDVITRQVEHMARLLDDLLDSVRMKRGELALKLAPAHLAVIVRDAVDAARPLIERKHHSLEINLPPESITLMVDAARMAQVLSNLLTNAAKYSDPGGRITVTATMDTDRFVIAVRDAGIGIRADAMPGLFSMFAQLQSSLDRTEGGLGIGLAFAQELVRLHGGEIVAHSDGENRGSEFSIALPASVLKRGVQPIGTERPPAERIGDSRRVLIADDNVDAAASLGMLLELDGHEVLIAHDGAEAVEVARRCRPQVAILDIGMPRLNGYQVAEQLRAESWGKNMLLVTLSGWGQADDKTRASAAGFDHHLTKPVDSDKVEALISAWAGPTLVGEHAPPEPSVRLVSTPHTEHAGRSADLLEANEKLVMAALHAETAAATAEHNFDELVRSSQKDALTGTLNRAPLLDRLESAIAIAKRHKAHAAVLFIDLDHFKQINDTYGHLVGDAVLQQVARCLEGSVRASDAVSRHGGDEFVVLLTEVSQRADAAAIAGKILKALADLAFEGVQMPPLTASIGISLYPEDAADAAVLISRADAAMYRAKQNGRSRFEFF